MVLNEIVGKMKLFKKSILTVDFFSTENPKIRRHDFFWWISKIRKSTATVDFLEATFFLNYLANLFEKQNLAPKNPTQKIRHENSQHQWKIQQKIHPKSTAKKSDTKSDQNPPKIHAKIHTKIHRTIRCAIRNPLLKLSPASPESLDAL